MGLYEKIADLDWNMKKQSLFLYGNMYYNIANLSFISSFFENTGGEYFSVSFRTDAGKKSEMVFFVKEKKLSALMMQKGYQIFLGEKTSGCFAFLNKIAVMCSEYLDDETETDDVQYSVPDEIPPMYYQDYYKSQMNDNVFSIKKSVQAFPAILAFPCSRGGVWVLVSENDELSYVMKTNFQHFLQSLSLCLRKIVL